MAKANVQNMPALRSSGHKEATEDHVTVAKMRDQGEGGDMEKLLQQRVLSNSQVSRAALYDEADFLCVGSSKQQFNVEPEDVRKVRLHLSQCVGPNVWYERYNRQGM